MNLFKALVFSLKDLIRGSILALVFLPGLGAVLFWVTLAAVFWNPIFDFTSGLGFEYLKLNQIPQWVIDFLSLTPERIAKLITLIIVGLSLVPLIILTSLVISSIFVMPVVDRVVSEQFPDIVAHGKDRFVSSVRNSIWASLIYVLLWIGTIPLWIVPGLTVAIPLALNGYINYRIYTYDCLSPYATQEEIQILLSRRRVDFLLLGFIMSTTLILPLMIFIMPIYSGLCFSRLCFLELRDLRAQNASIDRRA